MKLLVTIAAVALMGCGQPTASIANESTIPPIAPQVMPNVTPPTPSDNYPSYRRELFNSGWDAYISWPLDDPATQACGEICRIYPELMRCSGTTLAHCEWMFTNDGQNIVVETEGANVDYTTIVSVRYASAEDMEYVRRGHH